MYHYHHRRRRYHRRHHHHHHHHHYYHHHHRHTNTITTTTTNNNKVDFVWETTNKSKNYIVPNKNTILYKNGLILNKLSNGMKAESRMNPTRMTTYKYQA